MNHKVIEDSIHWIVYLRGIYIRVIVYKEVVKVYNLHDKKDLILIKIRIDIVNY